MPETDVFRAISHPLRRKILTMIHERGGASYKELSELEPKPGVLYHHLRLLGDLIYQDENKVYRLTEKGERAIEVIQEIERLSSLDSGINRILTPRYLMLKMPQSLAGALIALSLMSSLAWTGRRYALVGAFISPNVFGLPAPLMFLLSYAFLILMPLAMFKAVFNRRLTTSFLEHAGRVSIPALIASTFAAVSGLLPLYGLIALYAVAQGLVVLYLTAAYSVSFGLPLRRAVVSPALEHYLGVLAYAVFSALFG